MVELCNASSMLDTCDLKCVSVCVTVRNSVVRAGESDAVVCDRFMAQGPEL